MIYQELKLVYIDEKTMRYEVVRVLQVKVDCKIKVKEIWKKS